MNPNSKISLQRLAATLGLAKSTVSMALRDNPRISAATRQRVRTAAADLGYVQDADLATVMAHVQARQPRAYQGNIAIVPIIQTRVSARQILGCERRALKLGYRTELFADHPSHPNLAKLLDARGILGVVFVGWPWRNLPDAGEPLRLICERFPCSVVAARPDSPPMHGVMNDVHLSMRTAFTNVLRLGYRRPGALINPYLDDLQDQAYTGAFLAAQRRLPEADRIEPGYIVHRREESMDWIFRNRPDCIITHDNTLLKQLQAVNVSVPEQIGLVHLDLHEGLEGPPHSGIDQNHDLMGESAMDLVVAQIHRGEQGVPPTQKCLLVEGRWVEGETTKFHHAQTTIPGRI
jgi:LacI family transcriptional regulator